MVPQSYVSIRGANTFESKEEMELTGKGMKMKKIVVHDEDEASMWDTGGRLHDGMVVEADVMPFAETLLRDNAWGSALGHVGRMGSPTVELASMAILVGKAELNEPLPVDVNVDALDVDGVARLDVGV
jgi:hypothetical protein